MQELSIAETIKNVVENLLTSKAFILLGLEAITLIIYLIFVRLMNKKIVIISTTLTSLLIFGLYISNYAGTLKIFIDNVSTKLMEILYFPTTLEFLIVMIISFVIMITTLFSKKTNRFVKVVNIMVPATISFLFLEIIETINKNKIVFDEFSVFSNTKLMSLFELSMGIFIAWIIGLIIYKIDLSIIKHMNEKVSIPALKTKKEKIEMPKLKSI